jgi:hypothetical protein
MKKVIWKFKIRYKGIQEINMPKEAEILSVGNQKDNVELWAMVNPDSEMEARFIEAFNTGEPIPCDMGVERKFIGTVILDNGTTVVHIFERVN